MKGLQYEPGKSAATLTGQQIEYIQDQHAVQLFRTMEAIRAIALQPGMTPKKAASAMERLALESLRRVNSGMVNEAANREAARATAA